MNEKNLRPFKKGQSGNPKGKPKGAVSITTCLRKLLNKNMTIPDLSGSDIKISVGELIALRLVKDAIEGNHTAIKTILDRMEGPVTDKTAENITYMQMPSITIDGKEFKYDFIEKVKNIT